MSNVHPSTVVEKGAMVDPSARVWHFGHLREGSRIDALVSLGRDVYVDKDVHIGRGTRVQNGVSLYTGLEIGQWCFIGPHAIFTNDPYPRAGKKDWTLKTTLLKDGMSIGAGCVIRCGITVGEFAMLGAGAILTKSVPPFHLATGFPAKPTKMVCACGDTQLPLGSPAKELIRPCCRASLSEEVLEIAEKARKKLK
ncbi:MAG TPA: acyltransferase [Bdellovibrionota bacterium]